MVVLELYHKGVEDLTGPLLSAIIKPLHASRRAGPLSRVLLTYKGRPAAQENPKAAAALRSVLPPEVAISAVWSAKNAQVGSGKNARGVHASREDATFARFVQCVRLHSASKPMALFCHSAYIRCHSHTRQYDGAGTVSS